MSPTPHNANSTLWAADACDRLPASETAGCAVLWMLLGDGADAGALTRASSRPAEPDGLAPAEAEPDLAPAGLVPAPGAPGSIDSPF